MAVEIRNPQEDEFRAAMRTTEAAFGEEQKDEDFERHSKMLPRDRFLAAYDGGPVGTAASFPFTLTVPGGELAGGGGPPCAGAASRSPCCGRRRRGSTGGSATGSRRRTSI